MFAVYIMTNKPNGVLYTGMTDDLNRRAWEHRKGAIDGFSRRYGCNRLVWYEGYGGREEAFIRERRIKEWKRAWKIELIEKMNPDWLDLAERRL